VTEFDTRFEDTGERRRTSDAPLSIRDLIDEETVQSIAQEAWSALVGDDEFLVPLPGGLPDDAVSSWVARPWCVKAPSTSSLKYSTADSRRTTASPIHHPCLNNHGWILQGAFRWAVGISGRIIQ